MDTLSEGEPPQTTDLSVENTDEKLDEEKATAPEPIEKSMETPPEPVKGSPDLSHFTFEIIVGKGRIRHRTTLNLNDTIFN